MANEYESIYDTPEFRQFKTARNQKVKELSRRRGYYDGTVYKALNDQLGWLAPRMTKNIRPLFLPLARAVDVDAGIIPGGWAFESETVPEARVAQWEDARDLLFAWSRWAVKGVLYVHYGAQYGVSALKVSVLPDDNMATVRPVDPTNLFLVYGDRDDVAEISIWTETRGSGEDEWEYAEVITPSTISIYRDGEPWAPDGEPEWENELEEVPYVEIRHIENGTRWGEATFNKAIPLLDEVNNLASDLADVIEDHAEPQWAVIGAEPTELEHSGDNVWFIPEGGKVEVLLPPVDIAGILDFVREIKDGVHDGLPELAFDELRRKDQIATETLELQLMELVLKVQRTRPNYDEGLVKALRLAGRAGQVVGAKDLAALDDEMLEMDAGREVLPIDERTRMSLEMQEIELEREKASAMPQEGMTA